MSKALRCDLCNVQLSSQSLLDAHNSGKRHQKKVAERDALSALAARSVFISGLDPDIVINEDEIADALSCFGKVEKVHLDPKKKKYAIVEFDEEFSAHRAIFEDKLRIGYQVVTVRARKVDFNQCQTKSKDSNISVNKIINQINDEKTFVEQVDMLFDLYCLSDAQLAERATCTQMLTNALGDYFTSGVNVCMFGSSITSIGTKNSDIDASLFFDVPLISQQYVGDLARSKYTLLTCDVNTFCGRKICAEEYARLTAADRVRLLNKIMNDIRKRAKAPVTGQYPVLDARCPLVRFTINKKYTLDLSVDNRLGYAKSEWLRSVICCDSSQLIRRFLIAFRFWAHVNDLMKTDDTEDFFVWFIHLKLKDTVLCPYLGCTVKTSQFQCLYPDKKVQDHFKHAHLNIQDPLEWSHNVSMLVSEKRIAAMRRQMMFALSRMKIRPDSFVATLLESRNNVSGIGSPSSSNYAPDPLEIHLDQCSTTDQCLDVVNRIFTEIFAFSPAVEPFEKRPRLEDDSQELHRVYVTKRRTWEGRRNKRRQIIREVPALANDPVTLEETVTQQIYGTSEEVSLCFKMFVKQMDTECVLLFMLLAGSATEFIGLIHFLHHFIPTHFSYFSAYFIDEPMQ